MVSYLERSELIDEGVESVTTCVIRPARANYRNRNAGDGSLGLIGIDV